jgi:hypothetical protein
VDQADLLRLVAETLDLLGIPYAVTGSMACIVYGEPRQTHDIDVVIEVGMDRVVELCDAFPDPDFYVSVEAARDAVRERSMFNVLHPESGLKIDFIVSGAQSLDRSRMSRTRRIRIGPDPGGQPRFASPEDVIVKKLDFYRHGGSDKHLRDIAGIMRVMGDALDRTYIAEWAAKLGVMDLWTMIVKRTDQSSR